MASRRALIIEPAGRLYGSERALLDFLGVARDHRWELSVCCPTSGGFRKEAEQVGVGTYPAWPKDTHKRNQLWRLWALIRLLVIIIRVRPDLIHVNQAGASRIAGLAGRLTKVPTVAHVRLSSDTDYIQRLSSTHYAPDALLAVSPYVARQLDGSNGVTTVYDPYRITRAFNDANPGHGQTAPVFVCLGRVEPAKGQDIAVRAIRLLESNRGMSPRLKVLGGPGEDEEFLASLKRQAASESVQFFGFRSDVMSFLEDSVALICPSWEETFGRIILEAWDAGTVPIAWRESGGPAEIIEVSGGGLLYPEQSAESLANAMERAANLSAAERTEMVERGREWVRENCDPRRHAKKVMEVWSEVLRA